MSSSTEAIGSLVDRMAAAWNAADGDAFGELFADDADFVEIRGGLHHGRDAIAAGHQALFDSIYRGSTVTYRVERTREVANGVVIAIVGATLDAPTGPLAGTNHSRITAVAVRDDARWHIVSFHNTLVVGPPA